MKFSVFADDGAAHRRLLSGEVANVDTRARFWTRAESESAPREARVADIAPHAFYATALQWILDATGVAAAGNAIAAVGHRVVHGGDTYSRAVRITPAVLAELRKLEELAPLHQPPALRAIETLLQLDASLPQIACFDTAFHQSQPDVARRFGLPRALHDAGVKRYGFHGLSYEAIADALPRYLGARADGKVVVAHLGNGASLCAMRARQSVATTMGFTPLDGLVMGTRCGTLDPGVVLHLLRDRTRTHEQVEQLLTEQSGLRGVSGISADMRVLLASDAAHARDAVDLFVYRITREIGSMAAALGGIDALVFTGGVGENAAIIRERVCRGVAWLGVHIDADANVSHAARVTTQHSPVSAWVIAAREDEVIARHTSAALRR